MTAMSTSTGSDTQYFLWFSDIHYDPYYSTKDAYRAGYNTKAVCNSTSIPSMGSIGCDSPKALVDSALAYASEIAASPSFIVLSGDSIRHGVDMLYASNDHEGSESRVGSAVEMAAHSDYHTDAMKKAGEIINDLMAIIADAFPDVEVIVSIGNNDVVPDYYLKLQGETLPTDNPCLFCEDGMPDPGFSFVVEGTEKTCAELKSLVGNEGKETDLCATIQNVEYLCCRQTPPTTDTNPPSSNSSMTPEDSGMLGIIYNALHVNDEDESPNYNQVGAQRRRGRSLLSAEDSATFLKGGFYSRDLPDGLTVLSINTVLYSSFFGPEPFADDPGEQFTWMRNTLMNIRERGNSQAMIVGHVPPSMGSFRHTQLWKEKYINVYYEIIQEFDDVVAGQLFGHLHSDEFRVGVGKSAIPSSLSTPLLLTGSLTPIHGNNPSFRKVFYDGGAADDNRFKLLDYESHRHSVSDSNAEDWSKLYTFSETYNTATEDIKTEGLSANVFRSILQSMKDKQGNTSPTLHSFLSLVGSGSDGDAESSHKDNDCDAECRAEWMCTLSGTTTAKQYNTCLLQKSGSSRHMIGIAGAAVFAAAFLFMIVVRIRKRRARDQYESPSSIEGTVEMDDQEML